MLCIVFFSFDISPDLPKNSKFRRTQSKFSIFRMDTIECLPVVLVPPLWPFFPHSTLVYTPTTFLSRIIIIGIQYSVLRDKVSIPIEKYIFGYNKLFVEYCHSTLLYLIIVFALLVCLSVCLCMLYSSVPGSWGGGANVENPNSLFSPRTFIRPYYLS